VSSWSIRAEGDDVAKTLAAGGGFVFGFDASQEEGKRLAQDQDRDREKVKNG
jgi:hypothetical protein